MSDPIQGPTANIHARMMGPQTAQPLGGEKLAQMKSTVESILSKYDSSSLTTEDIKGIQQALRDAGVRPSRQVRQAIESAGFDPERLRPQGGPDAMPPPKPQRGGGGVNMKALQSFSEILDGYDLSTLSSEEEENLINQLNSSGLMRTGVMLDLTA